MGATAGPHDGTELRHVPERDRYEVREGEHVLGVLQYEDVVAPDGDGPVIRDLRSTVVAPEAGGRGIGSRLVRRAVADARAADLGLRATCWFARGWIERHPEEAGTSNAEEERA